MNTEKPAVLYVEDDAHSRRVMQLLLNNVMKLPNITVFDDSSNFLTRAEALSPKPDLIFLDIHMQPHSGFEMLEMLRQSDIFHDTPVVALTASVMNEEVIRLRTAGFDGCIAKPLNMEQFPQLLQAIMRGEEVWRIIG